MSSHDSHPVDPVSERLGHVVVVWRDITLVWGGYRCKYTVSEMDAEFYWDPAVVHAHDEGIWSARRTFGDVPPETSGAVAEVIHDFLFVACGMVRGSTERCVKQNFLSYHDINIHEYLPQVHKRALQAGPEILIVDEDVAGRDEAAQVG